MKNSSKKCRFLNIIKIVNGKGLSKVFVANVINKIVAFVANVIVVRVLTQAEYGLFSSANNIITFALLITGAGTLNGVLQYGSEQRSESEKNQYYRYSLFIGTVFDCILMLIVIFYAALGFAPIEGTAKFIIMLSPTIVLNYIYNYFSTVLRSQKEIVLYSKLLNINSILLSVLTLLGAYIYAVPGMVIGQCLAYIITIIAEVIYMRGRISDIRLADPLSDKQKRELLRYSIICCLIAALNRILYIIDIAIISYILKDPNDVAIYRTGITIPEALEFIPNSILVTVIPYFAQHNKDSEWLKKWTSKLYSYSGILNLVITSILYIAAPFIVNLLWGERYSNSVAILRIMTINYFVMATFRLTGTNILSTLRKVNYNLVASIITAITDIVLDLILTSKYGIVGAAFATLISAIIASILSAPYVYYSIYKRKKIA